jgi:predicted enzyme related to lactoylglutathione lyase
MSVKRIVPNISSASMEESKAFYSSFLGLKLVMDMDWILTFASDENPTAQVSILKNDDPGNLNTAITLSMEVADVDALYEKAKTLRYEIEYEITDEPWGVRRFWVKDPNGVIINIMSHTQ